MTNAPAEVKDTAKPAAKDALEGLWPGRIVYWWESQLNVGIVECPAMVVTVRRDSEGKRTGSTRLTINYPDGSVGTKPVAEFSEKPADGRWTWPMRADGSPNRD